MGLVDYHVHTYLCGHASGTPDDYIKAAISEGLLEIGFSDHAPLPEGIREGITMSPDLVEHYIALIEKKREKYNQRILIKIGLEVDYPFHNSFDKRYLTDSRMDYIIGSSHFLGDWIFDHPDYISEYKNRDIDELYSDYYDIVEKIILSGNFNIIGHFDLIKKFGHRPNKDFKKVVEKLADQLSGGDTAVEVNTSGLRNKVNEIYPSDEIIKILFNYNVPITLGSDSHNPEEIAYEFSHASERIRGAGYRSISGFSKRRRYDISI